MTIRTARPEDARATSISLWVVDGNARAISFYTAAGFRPEAGSIKQFELGGTRLQEARYVLQRP
jgi:hypothetical protein